MLSLLHKPPLPFALIPQIPTNEWQRIISTKALSQTPFAFCQDKVFGQWCPRQLRPSSHQWSWEVMSQEHSGLCRVPLSWEVEGDSLEGNTVFLLLLTHQLFPRVQVATFLLLSTSAGGVEHEQEWPETPTGDRRKRGGGHLTPRNLTRRSPQLKRKLPGLRAGGRSFLSGLR